MFKNKFFPIVCYEGEGAGAGAGAGGVSDGGNPPNNVPVAPWGADVNAPWKVADKPWYEVYVPEGPAREFYRAKNYGNPVQAFEAHYSANRMVNGNAVEIPGENAPPEAVNAFYTKLGRPATPADYKFDFGKTSDGKDVEVDKNLVEFGQKLAFETGLSPKRAQEVIVKGWQEFAQKQNEAYVNEAKAQNDAEVASVKQRYGDQWDTHRAAGERAYKALGIDQALGSKIEGAIGAAAMLELFIKIGKATGEGNMMTGGDSGGGSPDDPSKMTPEQAKARIEVLGGDKDFQEKYNTATHPQHEWAKQHMLALFAKAG